MGLEVDIGKKYFFTFILIGLVVVLSSFVCAATVSHTAEQILSGAFGIGDFTFNGSFNVQNSSGSSLFFVNYTSGNVGIGTTPSEKLHVSGSGETAILLSDASDSGRGLRLLSGTDANRRSFVTTNSIQRRLAFGVDLAEQLTIINTGNVGIGTATPSQKLVVVGDANVTGNLIVGGNISGGSPVEIVGGLDIVSGDLNVSGALYAGVWQKINSSYLSGATSVTFSNLAPNKQYTIIYNLYQNTAAGYLYVTFNNYGGNFYWWSEYVVHHGGSSAGTGGASATEIRVNPYTTTKAGWPQRGSFEFSTDPTVSSRVFLHGQGSHWRSDDYFETYIHGGRSSLPGALSSIEIRTSAGTVTGYIYLLELKV